MGKGARTRRRHPPRPHLALARLLGGDAGSRLCEPGLRGVDSCGRPLRHLSLGGALGDERRARRHAPPSERLEAALSHDLCERRLEHLVCEHRDERGDGGVEAEEQAGGGGGGRGALRTVAVRDLRPRVDARLGGRIERRRRQRLQRVGLRRPLRDGRRRASLDEKVRQIDGLVRTRGWPRRKGRRGAEASGGRRGGDHSSLAHVAARSPREALRTTAVALALLSRGGELRSRAGIKPAAWRGCGRSALLLL